ncbi:MAG TPA: hypothetical protein ENN22_02715 [bacterium]|nr:hypothetical protein [bacterium]HDP98079.1 hypothetical protein [bacterium]
MRHSSAEKWEARLNSLIDEIDDLLEDRYGHKYRLHPARSQRGRTSSKSHDGLFNIVASFSLGAGSSLGRGYVVDVQLATLEKVPDEVIKEIESFTMKKVRERLDKYFPNRDLKADLDGDVIKIYGDLSLGRS